METSSIKQSVVNSYGKLAKLTKNHTWSKLFSCCDTAQNTNTVAKAIGYTANEITSVPEQSNLGVGCGNPSALANIRKGQTIIDLGSGAGFDSFIVANALEGSGKVIGIDLSDDMLTLAKSNAKKGRYNNVEFIKGDIEQLPLDNAIADLVISNCVINLSLNKGDVYKEAFRVLKKGGALAISDIVLEKDLPEVLKNSLAGHVACVSGAERIDTYINYIENAGFTEIKIGSKTTFPLELMLADPQIQKLATQLNFNLNSDEAKDIAASVKSVSITARKKFKN
ncbi:arsenite methyltransferase [Spongiivirga sp. MCCC 1A20706]|uniref:arsenite methyltransferase n=1 Tax=Spongiivirga sp. MCCC 1A20706 TaxID=3160963 RepID=UPI003977B069